MESEQALLGPRREPKAGKHEQAIASITIGIALAALALAAVARRPPARAGSLLSGYGGPGQGNQAILGSALVNGRRRRRAAAPGPAAARQRRRLARGAAARARPRRAAAPTAHARAPARREALEPRGHGIAASAAAAASGNGARAASAGVSRRPRADAAPSGSRDARALRRATSLYILLALGALPSRACSPAAGARDGRQRTRAAKGMPTQDPSKSTKGQRNAASTWIATRSPSRHRPRSRSAASWRATRPRPQALRRRTLPRAAAVGARGARLGRAAPDRRLRAAVRSRVVVALGGVARDAARLRRCARRCWRCRRW